MARESVYQSRVILDAKKRLPGSVVIKLDPELMQGIPDLLILYGPWWALLEVKKSANSPRQPNQEYYIKMFGQMGFAAFIYPEIHDEVFDGLQQRFDELGRNTFIP
jgi:hypothetical protein